MSNGQEAGMISFPHNLIGYSAKGIDEFVKEGTDAGVVQVFLSEPTKFQMPSSQIMVEAKWLEEEEGVKVIFHGPIISNFLRENPRTLVYTYNYIFELNKILDRIDHEATVVFHTGKSGPDFGEANDLLIRSLEKVAPTLDRLTLCIECDPGSKIGTTVGRLDNLIKVVSQIEHPNLKVCYDTEHAWASGIDIRNPLPPYYFNYIEVIHLNAVPEEVAAKPDEGLEGYLDRHSYTRLIDSALTDNFFIPRTIDYATKFKIPMILERHGIDIIRDDIAFVLHAIGNEENK